MQTQAVNIWSLFLILIKLIMASFKEYLIAFKRSLMFFLNFRWLYFKKGNHVCLKENAVPIWHFFSTVPKCLGAELSFSTGAEMSWCRTVFFNGCRNVLVPNCLFQRVPNCLVSPNALAHALIFCWDLTLFALYLRKILSQLHIFLFWKFKIWHVIVSDQAHFHPETRDQAML